MKELLTQELVREFLHYDPDTGIFNWLERDRKWFVNAQAFGRWNTMYAGKEAGCLRESVSGKTYRIISILADDHKAHQLALLYMNGSLPEHQVDHESGDGTDNRWCNLRETTHSDNAKNQKLHCTNSSGVSGLTYRKDRNQWRVRISVQGKMKTLGNFKDYFEAVCARKSAELLHNYHINHGSVRPL